MKKPTKYEYIGELLRNLGLGVITVEQFWVGMEQQRFGQDDIDKWCAEYYRREEDGSQRSR